MRDYRTSSRIVGILAFLAIPLIIAVNLVNAESLSLVVQRLDFDHGTIKKVVADKDALYFLEEETHRVHVLRSGKAVQIGAIGNAKGELYYPFDLTVDGSGRLYVQDIGNDRIQILGTDGRYIDEIPLIKKVIGLAVNGSGEVFVGSPSKDGLVAVLDRQGHEVRALGRPVNLLDVYGSQLTGQEQQYQLPMSRAHLQFDPDGNLWVALLFAPVVLKFDQAGHLLFQKVLALPSMNPRQDALWKTSPTEPYLTASYDGKQMRIVSKGLAVDPRTKGILVLLYDDRLVRLSPDGNVAGTLELGHSKEDSLNSVAIDQNGTLYFATFLSPTVLKSAFPISK